MHGENNVMSQTPSNPMPRPQRVVPVAPVPVQAPGYPEPHDIGQDAGMRMLLPVGRSWVAIVAGYLGLFAVLLLPAPLALLAGIFAIFHIRANPNRHGMGRAIFAIVMGVLFSVVLAFVIIFQVTEARLWG